MPEADKNEKLNLKSKRVKSFFISAAKEIILNEGVENISVRKVADKAGYTFASIYNHFKDLNELLQDVKTEMIQDVLIHTQGVIPDKIYDLEDIKKTNRTYIEYYIERPHVFRFFYLYRLNPISTAPAKLPDFEKIWQSTYHGFVLKGILTETEIPVIAKTIIYAIHGLLSLYFSDNGMTKETVYEDIDKITDQLLKERN